MTAHEIDQTFRTFQLEVPVIIRLATKEDLPKLEWFGRYTHFRNVFRRTFREQAQGKRLMLVADYNRFPVGQLFVHRKREQPPPFDGRPRVYFYSLRVLDMFQGLGIGTHLLEEAEALVSTEGAQVAVIAAAKDNPRARKLYERLGYRVIGEDAGNWSYIDHRDRVQYVQEPCWVLEKLLHMR